MEIKTTAIVARYTNYRDYDRMITLLTPEFGRLDAVARGCRRTKSPLLSSTQLFAYAEFIITQKSERFTVTSADLRESFYALRLNLHTLEAATTVVQTSTAAAVPAQPCEELFAITYYTLSFLCFGENTREDLLITYLLKYLDNQGYCPSTTRCSRCGQSTYHNPRFHSLYGALCQDCALQKGGTIIDPLALEAMRRIISLPLKDLGKVILPKDVQYKLLECLPPYFERHVGRVFSF